MPDKTYKDHVFTLKLPGKDVDKILVQLSTLPYIEVFLLIEEIRKQAEAQKKTVT
jgi:hypothetical protein